MKTYLVTGGSGFLGTTLKKRLLLEGHSVVNVDLHQDEDKHSNLEFVRANIADRSAMLAVFARYRFDGVFHLAAKLAHAVESKRALWESNVTGTQIIAELTCRYRVSQLVFTSSNCLWGPTFSRPILETDAPHPVEPYGASKWEGERILHQHGRELNSVIFRCPTIIDSGRLGLLAILFEFIREGRRVWTVGDGSNLYQFIYAQDVVAAAIKGITYPQSEVFNIGSDDVRSIREIYEYVITKASSKSEVACLPKRTTRIAMRLAYDLKLSPLGPYHYKMIAEDFIFNTDKIKQHLNWRPTLTNEEMLWRAYRYYADNHLEIQNRGDASPHRQPAAMGLIRLLKLLSGRKSTASAPR